MSDIQKTLLTVVRMVASLFLGLGRFVGSLPAKVSRFCSSSRRALHIDHFAPSLQPVVSAQSLRFTPRKLFPRRQAPRSDDDDSHLRAA